MSVQAIHAEPCNDPGPRAADAQAYRQALHDLIAMGTDLARFLHSQAAAHAAQQAAAHPIQPAANTQQAPGAPPAPAPDALISLAAAFDRTARAVRRSILLARSLDSPVQTAPDPAGVRAAARRRILRAVEDTIGRTATSASDGQDGPEALRAELRDRLDAPDLDWDISARPAADIITEICRDLGLAAPAGSHPWKRRTPDDIARLCAQAAAPSSARQPGTCQPGIMQQMPKCDAAQPTPGPQPDQPAAARAQPGPVHPGSNPPEDPAATLATILRHPAPAHSRWRPPPQA